MTESQFKCKVVKLLKAELPGAWIYHPSDKWRSGIPDLLICYKHRFGAVELKVGTNQATALQLHTLKLINAAGGATAVCWTMDEVKNFLRDFTAGILKEGK